MRSTTEKLLHLPAPPTTPIEAVRARQRQQRELDSQRAPKKDPIQADGHDAEILELCSSTRGALQELRHGIIYALYDILDKLNVDRRTLQVLIQEPAPVVSAIVARDLDDLGTEKLIDILEILHSRPKL